MRIKKTQPGIIPTQQLPINISPEDVKKVLSRLKIKDEFKIVFFGNTRFSVISLEKLNSQFPVQTVLTLPDQFLGRNKLLTANPVKQFAIEKKIQIIEADRLTEEIIQKVASIEPDFIVVADYGLILPQKLLDLPKFAPLNIHHSLLPKFRGPAPVPFAILEGVKITGVTIIKMTDRVDAGDILAQESYSLLLNDTTETVLTKLNELGGYLAGKVIEKFLKNDVKPVRQDESKASYTKRFTKEDGYFDLPAGRQGLDLQKLDRMIRAFYPWPTVWTKWSFDKAQDKNGKLIKFLPGGLIQMEGKKPVTLKQFLNGYPNFPLKTITNDLKETENG